MAFLDNSCDIILDAVLTDEGRKRLSKGDGNFKITKFALGDDEVDYSLFVGNTGSAYQDLSILQTPVFEAFTNNASSMKSSLMSLSAINILYLPILQLNELRSGDVDRHSNGMFTVATNKETEDKFNISHKVMYGENPGARHIEIDQGIDSAAVPATISLAADQVETQYLVTMDDRFGSIISDSFTTAASKTAVDDDSVATYILTKGTLPPFVTMNANTNVDATIECIAGSRGSIIKFRILASLTLSGGGIFDEEGSTVTMTDVGGTSTYKYIDTTIGVKGLTTGYRIDVPVRYIRYSS